VGLGGKERVIFSDPAGGTAAIVVTHVLALGTVRHRDTIRQRVISRRGGVGVAWLCRGYGVLYAQLGTANILLGLVSRDHGYCYVRPPKL
jgi:hypothetical protein